jgi:hypothetical protein
MKDPNIYSKKAGFSLCIEAGNLALMIYLDRNLVYLV